MDGDYLHTNMARGGGGDYINVLLFVSQQWLIRLQYKVAGQGLLTFGMACEAQEQGSVSQPAFCKTICSHSIDKRTPRAVLVVPHP